MKVFVGFTSFTQIHLLTTFLLFFFVNAEDSIIKAIYNRPKLWMETAKGQEDEVEKLWTEVAKEVRRGGRFSFGC